MPLILGAVNDITRSALQMSKIADTRAFRSGCVFLTLSYNVASPTLRDLSISDKEK
jgi:hypothetical protein